MVYSCVAGAALPCLRTQVASKRWLNKLGLWPWKPPSSLVKANLLVGKLSCLHDVVADRVTHKSSLRMNIELLHYRRAVRFYRFQADAEKGGDLFALVSFRDQLQHTALSVRERRP
jgi:hypothetical protein